MYITNQRMAKGGTRGFMTKFLMDKAISFADSRCWDAFSAILSLLIYVIVLYPNLEDLASIYIFMTKNPVPTLLADTYYSIHLRN